MVDLGSEAQRWWFEGVLLRYDNVYGEFTALQ